MFVECLIDHTLAPIRSLNIGHKKEITEHLLCLDSSDRYLRFGYAAQDSQIYAYAEKLNFERDQIFGVFDQDLELEAIAHLAFDGKDLSKAEFGVSVLKRARGKGYGSRLFERAAMHARNQGVETMYIHALSENTTMIKIARDAGASVERDGSESAAYLQLPEPTLSSRLGEVFHEQWAMSDYRFKVQNNLVNTMTSGIREYAAGLTSAALAGIHTNKPTN
jgi:GNAT superfamily N-acetyltransferase